MKKDEIVGSQRGDRSTWARALAVLGVCFVVACSQSVPAESGGEAGAIEEALPMTEWQRALFPPQNTAKLAVQLWGRHRALTFGGRVHASNGEDITAGVGASLWPLAVSDRTYTGQRWAIIGVGSGIEMGFALSTRPEVVDLYEPTPALIALASELSDVNLLHYKVDRPINERLKIHHRPPQSGGAPTYDIVVHSTSLTVISEPYRMFEVERFRALQSLLRPGGRVVIHVQLYEIRPETVQNLLRTFAEVFPHVALVVPEDLSADTFLLGSDQPLGVHLPTVRQMRSDGALQRFFELALIQRDTDLAARVLLADREEVLAFAESGKVYTRQNPMKADELPRRPPPPPPGADVENGSYEAVCKQFSEQHGFVEDLPSTFYSSGWAFGSPCPDVSTCRLVKGLNEWPARADELSELALSLLAHGQKNRSRDLIEELRDAYGGRPRIDRAISIYKELLNESTKVLQAQALVPDETALNDPLGEIDAHLKSGSNRAAADRATKLLENEKQLTLKARSALTFVESYAKCCDRDWDECDASERLLDHDRELVTGHPEVLYHLARCLAHNYNFGAAVLLMERYVDRTKSGPIGEVSP